MTLRLYIPILFLIIATASCAYPVVERRSPTEVDIKLETVELPKEVQRGEDIEFVIKTSAMNRCMAGVGFWSSKNNEWTFSNFQEKIATDEGICKWIWKVPQEAKSGFAEFRLVVYKEMDSKDMQPYIFCIEECSEQLPER